MNLRASACASGRNESSRSGTLRRHALLLLLVLAAPVAAQNPPTPPKPAPPDEVQPVEQGPDWPAQTWLMPEVQVVGARESDLKEEERIGSYGQPRWTAVRRFPTTRIYVLPEGEIDAEYWMRVDEDGHGETTVTHLYEIEMGLPHRFQLDLYVESKHGDEWDFTDETARLYELRYALADWGVLWGNPTLYYEYYDSQHGTDKREAKLLLGDELAEGWHWGTNVVYEKEVSGSREGETELTAGLSKTLIDERFSLGGELKANRVTEKGESGSRHEIFAGPSLQYRPSPRAHIDFAPLVGFGGDSGDLQIWFIAGWEF